jgi:tartrate-resistant acid phosphatase type 5
MLRLRILFPIFVLTLCACGPTTRPSDLVARQTQVPHVTTTQAQATVAGTLIALPLIGKAAEITSAPVPSQPPATTQPPAPTATAIVDSPLRFAVIGDYGSGVADEADVANLVVSWQPEFIITTGDNNYPSGSAQTIDAHVGQYYHAFIYPYQGSYGEGADTNRFFPTLGNHDWDTASAQPYLDYFTLPGNERYYDFSWGPVQFFALDGDYREPDGVGANSTQAAWLQAGLANSTAPWNIVYLHHPPYSSGLHGSVDWVRWPYQEWGADVVLSGHDHTYERLLVDGFPYFVNGLGGGGIYQFINILDGSQVRYNGDYGALLVEASANQINFQFITRKGEVVDTYTITH